MDAALAGGPEGRKPSNIRTRQIARMHKSRSLGSPLTVIKPKTLKRLIQRVPADSGYSRVLYTFAVLAATQSWPLAAGTAMSPLCRAAAWSLQGSQGYKLWGWRV